MRSVPKTLSAAISVVLLATSSHAAVWRVENVPAESLPALQAQVERSYDYGGYVWIESDQPPSVPAGTKVSVVEDAGRLRFGAVDFDPLREALPAVNQQYSTTPSGHGLRLLQLHAPAKAGWLDALSADGMRVLQYYPHQGYLVWADEAAVARASAREFVRWQGEFVHGYKINSDLQGREGPIRNVQVHFYNDGNLDQMRDWFKSLGVATVADGPSQPDKAFWDIWLQLDASQLDLIASHPQVLWMGYASPERILEDEMSDQIQVGNYDGAGVPQVGYLPWLIGFGFEGTGVTWAVVDTGADRGHPDLAPNLGTGFTTPDCPGTGGDDSSDGGHGTHVSGTIVGLGIGDGPGGNDEADAQGFLYGLGVAPSATVYPVKSGCGSWPPAGGWQRHSQIGVTGGAMGMNASWTTGEGTAHGYQASERTHDLMVRNGDFDTPEAEPWVIVFSAGNSGAQGASSLTAPKEAKNVIVTGASRNFRIGSIDAIAGFSSRGPAVDGRVGPTITAPGERIASTRRRAGAAQCGTSIADTGGNYSFCSGTSMAAPHASGAVVQLTEWWRSENAGDTPSPAMLKALLVNGAIDMGTPDIPNNNEGWGRVHVPNSIGAGIAREYVDQTEVFDNTGEEYSITVGVSDPSEPLKITLAWTDAAGAVGANPALVNNLDLEVVTDGSTYLGNVFSSGQSVTSGTADTLNNIENVFVDVPGGDAVITVKATAINGDGVPGGDATDQDFALICSNCALQPTFTMNVDSAVQSVCSPDGAAYGITIGSILDFDEDVTLSMVGHPAGTTAGFSDNPVTPPGTSGATIGSMGAAAPGSYALTLTGTSATVTKDRGLQLNVFDSSPSAPALTSPADASANQPVLPTLVWEASSQAAEYLVELDDDPAFGSLTYSETVTDTEVTLDVDLMTNTTYHWRVTARNTCGETLASQSFSFLTAPAPGECNTGNQPTAEYEYGFEDGASGWTSSGTGNTWAQSSQRANSGSFSWKAVDPNSISDQRLVSPPFDLPTGQSPLSLQFFHYRDLEENGASACYDAGILEVSTSAGGSWSQVPSTDLLTDPYDGPVNSQFSNPLSGMNGWCNLRSWRRSIVDIDDYAGQTVQFRFRLGSDSGVGAEGWYIDDVRVQSCGIGDDLFEDGFE